MKLRNIFTALAAVAMFAFTGCQEEERFLAEVKVSQSYIAIPAEGGQVEVTVNAADAWEIADIPEWLTVTPATGAQGETKVTFSAEAAEATREAILHLNCGEVTQVLNALQMTEKVETPISTCKEVNAGETGKIYRIKGTVTSIANTTYGNMYIDDGTDVVYVYGTLYEGAEKEFSKHGIDVGDIVTVEGPMSPYNGSPQLKNVTVIAIEKSLIKVDEVSPENATLPLEGGEFTVTLTCKGEGLTVEIPEAAKSWLSVTAVTTDGTSVVVTFTAAPNAGGNRSVELEFVTVSNGTEYKAVTSLSQEGAIIETTADQINAAEDGETLYRLTGVVKSIKSDKYGNIYIADYTGEVYVYGTYDAEGNRFDAFATPVEVGDIVTVCGVKTSYNGSPQMKNVTLENHIQVTPATIGEFLEAPESKEAYYLLTGTVSGLDNAGAYGNVYLTDETGEVYVYGLLSGWGGPKKEFETLVANVGLAEGDKLTIVGVRSAYNGTPQVGSAFYLTHEAGAPAVDPWETAATAVNGAEATDDARLKELKAYADADYLYVRLTATKETPFGADYLDFFFTDGEGETAVWWGWTTTGTDIYYQEHKCELNTETGELTKMRWYPVEGDRVYIDDYATETTDSEVVWTMKFPRSYVDVYKSSTNTVRMSFLLWNGWDGYWAIPARGNEMLEVTLP